MPVQEGFAPSRHGFAFGNAWPSAPAVALASPFGQINVGNADGGLCGGMVFAAVDYWHAAMIPPAGRPAPGDPLYGYIVRRLVDSWHLPAGVAQYFQWMNLPDGDTGFDVLRRHVVIDRGLAWRTVRMQWPQIRADLDRGTPAALGLVTVASSKPADLALNHQVLAYGYDRSGNAVTVRVYDPNRAGATTSGSASTPARRRNPRRSPTTSASATRSVGSSAPPTVPPHRRPATRSRPVVSCGGAARACSRREIRSRVRHSVRGSGGRTARSRS